MPSRGRLIKTKQAKIYDSIMEVYKIKQFHNVQSWIKSCGITKDTTLSVMCLFVFHQPRVFSKKNTLKTIDVSNRVKQTHDWIAKIIDVDDSRFVRSDIIKSYSNNPQDEMVLVKIDKSELLSFDVHQKILFNL